MNDPRYERKNVAAGGTDSSKYVHQLSPSGGDDSPAILAAATETGVVKLGPGTFQIDTPLILRAKNAYRSGTNAACGLTIKGAGKDLTFLDTSGAGCTSHEVATVTAVTVGATTTGTLSAASAWADGSQVVLSFPNYRRNQDAPGNTIDLLNGQVVFLKATNRAGGTFTTFQLYCDPSLTTPLISTGWGTFATPARMRRYEHDRSLPYTPVVRLTAPVGDDADIYNINVTGLTFRNTLTQAIGYDRQGICVSLESDSAAVDTIIAQNVVFENVRWEGYDACVLLDDVTDTNFSYCDMHGNNYYVWAAFNIDIVKFENCMLGEDFPTVGQPLPQVVSPALVYYGPLNPAEEFSGSRNCFLFDTCWFMGVRAITGGSQIRTYGSNQVYWTNGINPKPLTLLNCYFENVSWLADGQAIAVRSCHFGNFSRDANLTNGRAVFNLLTDNYDGARMTIEDCTCDPTPGNGPLIAYVSTANWGGSGGQANEETTPTVIWRNNNLAAGAGAAHLIDFLNPTRKILLPDNFASGDQVKAGGDYVFEGMIQTGGRTRIRKSANPAPATVTPDIADASMYWVGLLTGNVTIANPTLGGASTFSSLFAGNGVSAASYFMFAPLRTLPLEIIVEQDATGGRTITFGSDFITTGLRLTGAANEKIVYRFAWNGAKWAPLDADGFIPITGTLGTFQFRVGTGNPEGTINAPVGNLFIRTDGGLGATLYVKSNGTGSTGWAAMTSPILTAYTQTASYTLGSVDYALMFNLNHATGALLNIPTNASAAIPVGAEVYFYQSGAGPWTFTPAGGVTLRAPNGTKTGGQYSRCRLWKVATNEWVLDGQTAV